jgi:soluble lytic murein transglycosylase-like protein
LIDNAAADRGVPADLLARVLWQESRFRPDIINGTTRSSAGAVGIAQFMPATADDLGIDPLDPAQAIDGAARYLAQLHRMFGNWREALAAYNWGMGNVSRRGIANAPAETREYVASIMGDIFGSESA